MGVLTYANSHFVFAQDRDKGSFAMNASCACCSCTSATERPSWKTSWLVQGKAHGGIGGQTNGTFFGVMEGLDDIKYYELPDDAMTAAPAHRGQRQVRQKGVVLCLSMRVLC